MAGVSRRIETSRTDAVPDNLTHRLTGQAAIVHPAMAIHWSKDRSFADTGDRQPVFQGCDWTPSPTGKWYSDFLPPGLLVRLRPKQVLDHTLTHLVDIADI